MQHRQIDFPQPRRIDMPDPLAAHYLPGSNARLVVSLAGFGRQRGRVPPAEFVGTASDGGQNHVLFIADASRSWMNGAGVRDAIADLIVKTRDRFGLTEVATLGNSMGGFAALVLADMIPVKTAIAFGPQFSMHPDLVPEETRWAHFADQITDWPVRDVGALDADGTSYYIFHGANPWEARHWLRFPWGPHLNHFIFDGLGHDVAARLRKRRLLPRILDTALRDKPRLMRRTLERAFLGMRFSAARREIYQPNHPEITLEGIGAPIVIPHRTEDET